LSKRTETVVVIATVLAGWQFLSLAGSSGCAIKAVSGLPCPGCGLTRAWIALFQGHVREAFRHHPLFPLALVIIAGMAGKWLPRCSLLALKERGWSILLILFCGVYVVRMIFLFPHALPMDFNTHAIFPRIFIAFLTWMGVI